MADERLHEMLLRAELEDCKLLQKEVSAYLEFWGIARDSTEAGLEPPEAPGAGAGESVAAGR
jgi:hypothetical protein